jgi:acyl-CoA synthetase (AMP-forming)/AMP-acid ligase II
MRPATVGELFDAGVARDPGALALVDADRRVTYSELEDEVARATRLLAERGVRRGTTVAGSAGNGIELVVAFLATMRVGARWVGVNPRAPSADVDFVLHHCRARLLLTDRGDLDDLPATASPNLALVALGDGTWRDAIGRATPLRPASVHDPLAPAAIAYTSGTTGRPKGVVHSQHNLALPARYFAATDDFGDDSVVGVALPFTTLNVMIISVLPTLFAGRPCIAVPKLDAATIARWITDECITNLSVPPPILYDVATRDDIDPTLFSTLRAPRTGGAELPDATRTMFAARVGCEVVGTYGLTEAPATVTIEPRGEPHVAGSSGRAVPYVEVRIVDAVGRELPTGETGEITVCAATRGAWRGVWRPMLGYWRRPAATRDAVRNGTLFTGDVGRLDADGNLFVLDRKGNLITRGGANVYPAEVERVVRQLPGVAHSAVVGIPDPRLGERVGVAIEREPGTALTREAVVDHCRSHLAREKVPEVVLFLDALPRNAMGKVIVTDIRDMMESNPAATSRSP